MTLEGLYTDHYAISGKLGINTYLRDCKQCLSEDYTFKPHYRLNQTLKAVEIEDNLTALAQVKDMTLYIDYLSDKERCVKPRRHLLFSYDGITIYTVEDTVFNQAWFVAKITQILKQAKHLVSPHLDLFEQFTGARNSDSKLNWLKQLKETLNPKLKPLRVGEKTASNFIDFF